MLPNGLKDERLVPELMRLRQRLADLRLADPSAPLHWRPALELRGLAAGPSFKNSHPVPWRFKAERQLKRGYTSGGL